MQYDIAVIGGGPCGYVAAIRAAQQGASVILFERDVVGGTCLNRGCIPTKTYLKTAETIREIRHSAQRGIVMDTSLTVDMPKAREGKNQVVKTLTGGVASLLRSNGVKVVGASACIQTDRSIAAGRERYQAKNILIASGSKVGKPPIPGADDPLVVTSDEMLDLDYVPRRLLVVGGGVVGLELATVFAQFGSEVTVVELAERVLPGFDGEVSAEIARHLEKLGIPIRCGTQVRKFTRHGESLRAGLSEGGDVECDLALISIGRQPVTEQVCLLPLEKDGRFIRVDACLRTSQPGIYAAGDVTGKMMLAHAGSKMGEIAVHNILRGDRPCDLSTIPSCVYTMPEIGCVGLTEEQAKSQADVSVGKFPFSANGRSLAGGESAGFVKLLADSATGQILGCHIVGPCAVEMVNQAALAMDAELTVRELAGTMQAHPTFSEALMEAANDALGMCVHLPVKKK